MPSKKQAILLRLGDETYSELYRLHSGYGEASSVVRQLAEAYVVARKAGRKDVDAIAGVVIERVR